MQFFFSEILYPKEATSPHSGVSADHLCRGRDYVVGRRKSYHNTLDTLLLSVLLRVGLLIYIKWIVIQFLDVEIYSVKACD